MDLRALWPTTLLEARHPDPGPLNRELAALFDARVGTRRPPTQATPDDLLARHPDHPGLQALFGFLTDLVFEAASAANEAVWAELAPDGARIVVVGAWFQLQNAGGRHGVHTHGNCSWSGLYVVDVDDDAVRAAHPRLGPANGVTRFHGPHLARLGGAHVDLGNAYLQRSHHDVAPAPGKAVVFPSWLLHEALPYEGTRDRLIVSFNAQLHGRGGAAGLPYGF
jgi:uncharacterized protein (TIGR02466 family)